MIPQSRVSRQIKKIIRDQNDAKVTSSNKSRRQIYKSIAHEAASSQWSQWFHRQGWTAFPFQEQAWAAFSRNKSILIAVPTGSGKTYAALGGPLLHLMSTPLPQNTYKIIYLTPLKALARDIAHAIDVALKGLNLPFQVAVRTGDSSTSERKEQSKNIPEILVTTPESLAILLTGSETSQKFRDVFSVIVDEWHELVGTKRGSLLELTLASLKFHAPQLRVTALSATLGNLKEAAQVITGDTDPKIITDANSRTVNIDVLVPREMGPAPWFGYAGLLLIDEVLGAIDPKNSQILFTNTRGQAEAWHREILSKRPEWREKLALHHGSLALEERAAVEAGVKSGQLKVIVATSSLELGVDFPQVKKIFQIGAVKSLARAVQRAGRGHHQPGKASELIVCPTSLFEIIEAHALKKAKAENLFESKHILQKPIDVFVQFLLNNAFNQGFSVAEVRQILDSTVSFKDITDEEIQWALQFLTRGGKSLVAYPQFKKLMEVQGRYVFTDAKSARTHRMNIGTIVSDDGIRVRFATGKTLGTIGESFVSRLQKGDVFQFGGKDLEFIQLRDTTLLVRLAKKKSNVSTIWTGSVLPISSLLSQYLRESVDQLARAESPQSLSAPELKRFWPVALQQKNISHIPRSDENLVELLKSREGYHLFMYPWAGRLVHEGLGHLMAYRMARVSPNTISVAANDYGFELLALEPLPSIEVLQGLLSSSENLMEDIEASLNYHELSKRAFREVARVSGLVQSSVGGRQKTQRNLQMSSSLLYDVFEKYEPDHLLLKQARREVQSQQLHLPRLLEEMNGFRESKIVVKSLTRLSPFSFPLFIERIRSRVSTETLEHRIARFQRQIVEG
ncbi:MAG: ligase-associated DNA damage response DEXH box helicase [Bdellovibrionales bacterium]|nr:ligase-associated DNA damage response DEXH box helicase [Bdellovibrionales bacterium]